MRTFASGFVGGAISLLVLLLAYYLFLFFAASQDMQKAFNITRALTGTRLLASHNHISRPFLPVASTIKPTSSNFSSSARMAHASLSFLEAAKHRRSIYGLDKKVTIDDKKIREIAEDVVRNVPSSFNSQSARLVVLVKQDHDRFWEIVTGILKAHVPEDKWEHTGQRLDMFKGGYGTVLFYEDPEPIKALQSKFPQYADKFPQWSEHTSAMHQFAMWTALEAEGLGANLQHYNPLPDQKASEEWNIPLEWSLKAQLVFGNPVDAKRETLAQKTFEPIEKRLMYFGA